MAETQLHTTISAESVQGLGALQQQVNTLSETFAQLLAKTSAAPAQGYGTGIAGTGIAGTGIAGTGIAGALPKEEINKFSSFVGGLNAQVQSPHAQKGMDIDRLMEYAQQDTLLTEELRKKLAELPKPVCSECGESPPCAKCKCNFIECECACCEDCDKYPACKLCKVCDAAACNDCCCCLDCSNLDGDCTCCSECGETDASVCEDCYERCCNCTKCEDCESHDCHPCDGCDKNGCECKACEDCEDHDCDPCEHCERNGCDETCICCQACGEETCEECNLCIEMSCECECEKLIVDLNGPQGAMNVKVIPANTNCEHCMGLELAGPGTGKHAFMTMHKTDVPNSFLATCNQCHTFWIQDRTGWARAEFVKEGQASLVPADGSPDKEKSLAAQILQALPLVGGFGKMGIGTALALGAGLGGVGVLLAPTARQLIPALKESKLLPENVEKMLDSQPAQILINIASQRPSMGGQQPQQTIQATHPAQPYAPQAQAPVQSLEPELEMELQNVYDVNGVLLGAVRVPRIMAPPPKPAA